MTTCSSMARSLTHERLRLDRCDGGGTDPTKPKRDRLVICWISWCATLPSDAMMRRKLERSSALWFGSIGVEAKAAVRMLLDQLPDDCTLEEVQYHLYIL